MSAYYNEIDPYAAAWLRNLIAGGHISSGDVDERSIKDVKADDLRGYTQAHFFAGIGGWSLGLRIAGWPDERPVWTGSCPCQPFSAAGKGKAADDERHLWPAWFSLIAKCRPATIFGEQVEAAIGWGWLDLVCSDLESQGYACGAAVLPACGVGAPHIRQRLWFVADGDESRRPFGIRHAGNDAEASGPLRGEATEQTSADGGMGQPDSARSFAGDEASARNGHRHSALATSWSDCDWLPCTDGKARPVEPGIFPLAHGVSARVGKLRAAGNAIIPQVAAEFIAGSAATAGW